MDFGSDYYSHFTSPIRRYSDLYTHRTISKYLEGIHDFGNIAELESVAEHISDTERIAQKMEREYDTKRKQRKGRIHYWRYSRCSCKKC